jgi:hypothetical protein
MDNAIGVNMPEVPSELRCTQVFLWIYGPKMNPASVTAALGLIPSAIDEDPPQWMLSSSMHVESSDLTRHLDWLESFSNILTIEPKILEQLSSIGVPINLEVLCKTALRNQSSC